MCNKEGLRFPWVEDITDTHPRSYLVKLELFEDDHLRAKKSLKADHPESSGSSSKHEKLEISSQDELIKFELKVDKVTKLTTSISGQYAHCDVSVESGMEHAVLVAVDWKGRLVIMFNNSGVIEPDGSITGLKTEPQASLLAVNLYKVVQWAILGLAKSTACELGVHEIQVDCVSLHGIQVNCVSLHGVPLEMLVGGTDGCLGI
ncbi:Short-chain dehydrogenase reductase ATA1 [Striga hermonthica]|uniref:Short-chain dehydrogenase reductase ATA1 n=1 Tax=Striga hermonthica TaxID=68872 RepID=A0A9N7N8Q5_STRHE|nr:Short-chain dehydrogenase reductase ATA1 [Striga hermonthica]